MGKFNLIALFLGSVVSASSSLVNNFVRLQSKNNIHPYQVHDKKSKDYVVKLLYSFENKPLILDLKGIKKDHYSLSINNSVIQDKLRRAIFSQYFIETLGGEVTKDQIDHVAFSPLHNKKGEIIGKSAFPEDSSEIILTAYYYWNKVDIKVIGLFSSLSDAVDDFGQIYNIEESAILTSTEEQPGGELKLKNTQEAHAVFREVLLQAVLSQNKQVTREMLNLIYFNDFQSDAFWYHTFLHKGKFSYVTGIFYGEKIRIALKILPTDPEQRRVNYYLFSHFNPWISNDYLTIPFISDDLLPASDPRITEAIRRALINYSVFRWYSIITADVAQQITFNIISSKGNNKIAAHNGRIWNITAVFRGVEFPMRVQEKESNNLLT